MGLFLELNGWRLMATAAAATTTFIALAAGQIDEPTLAAWVRDNSAAT